MKFENLGLDEQLLKAVTSMGFETPTEIQEKSIPALLSGTTDFVGLAQTGTGKTAAFGLPLLQLVNQKNTHPQALIVCPTRELCMQIVKEIGLFMKFKPGMNVVAVYGGAPITNQIRDIKKGVQIVVATPGRLIDLIERKAIYLDEIHYLVLDEADEMLNMGFREDIEFVLKHTPHRQSTWLFSATMPTEVKMVSKKYMREPLEVSVGTANTANKNIDHQYFLTKSQSRYETLKRLIDFNPGMYGIIFTRTKVDAQRITENLTREGYDVDALHGDLSQGQRDKVMGAFRSKALNLVIATDVAARGIDVKDVSHVVNYELPDEIEVYTHRSGRTGRAGKTGMCLSIVTPREMGKVRQIEKKIQSQMHKLEIPSGKDVCRKQFFHFIEKMLTVDVSHGDYETYVPLLEEKFADISKSEILKRFAALEFDRFLKYYENAGDLNVRDSDVRDRNDRGGRTERGRGERGGDRGDRGNDRGRREYEGANRDSRGNEFESRGDQAKLIVNLGSKDGFYKASFLQFILDMSGLRKEVLGKVDLKDTSAKFDVDVKSAGKMIKSLDGRTYKGRKIRVREFR